MKQRDELENEHQQNEGRNGANQPTNLRVQSPTSALEELHKNSLQLQGMFDTLVRQHPNKWVAVTSAKVYVCDNPWKLIDELAAHSDFDVAAVEYMEPGPDRFIGPA
jgi:hypothetical protein